MWYTWLVASGIFFIIEILSLGFLVFWLGIAALITMVVSLFTDSFLIQFSVFLVSSCILIPLTKPFSKKILKSQTTPMNTDSLVGKQAIVIQEINTTLGTGQVKVKGETWSARCAEETSIPKDSTVKVLGIEGVKLIVAPKK